MAVIAVVSGCRCWHSIRIAELVDTIQVERARADNLARDLRTERDGTALLLAERKRMENNNLLLAAQLDERQAEYHRRLDAADEANDLERRRLRDEVNYYRSLCERPDQQPWKLAALAACVACLIFGFTLHAWIGGAL